LLLVAEAPDQLVLVHREPVVVLVDSVLLQDYQ
jgi:hypothetical protein